VAGPDVESCRLGGKHRGRNNIVYSELFRQYLDRSMQSLLEKGGVSILPAVQQRL